MHRRLTTGAALVAAGLGIGLLSAPSAQANYRFQYEIEHKDRVAGVFTYDTYRRTACVGASPLVSRPGKARAQFQLRSSRKVNGKYLTIDFSDVNRGNFSCVELPRSWWGSTADVKMYWNNGKTVYSQPALLGWDEPISVPPGARVS